MEHTGRRGANNTDINLDNDALPSYQDATRRADWLGLVAPYVPVRDYARLCLVSKRFYRQFAPRLWNDPFAVICMLRQDYDPGWVRGLLGHAAGVRPATRFLVRSFDTRCFFSGDLASFQYADSTASLSGVLFSIASAFGQLSCIFLDGYPGLEPEGLVNPLSGNRLPPVEPPLLLSIARCQTELPPSFFASAYLRSLVYLDVSDMPGSLKSPLIQRTFSPAYLPSLRILKSQGREMDNATASLLFKAFEAQLWSVDVSRNKLTDDILDDMHHFSFPAQTLRTDRFAVEGRHVVFQGTGGTPSFGQFCFVSESEWSQNFSHPHRHVADPPRYASHQGDEPSSSISVRLNGKVKIRLDSADALKRMFSGGAGSHGPSLQHAQGLDVCRGHQGITHLYLNGNNISAAGLARMIRSSPGQLQRLECDTMSFRLPDASSPSWLSRARLSGTLGWAHVFRPVFSVDLQELRVHHSLVTQTLSVELDGLPAMARLWVAETCLLPRAELAYPEAFVPDMNPRLQSLVLTRVPRYSAGPLIEKLVNFLKLASIQEGAIREIEMGCIYPPVTLPGLRHIRLEFEPDPREEFADGSDAEFDLDAGAVMDDSSKEFSFFGGSGWSSAPSPAAGTTRSAASVGQAPKTAPPAQSARPAALHTPELSAAAEPQRARAPSLVPDSNPNPNPVQHSSYNREYLYHTWTWNACTYIKPIFIGKPSPSPGDKEISPAVREYARLVRAYPALQCDPVSVTPCHVRAGLPRGEYIFSAAWEAILCPVSDTAMDLNSMSVPMSTSASASSLTSGSTSILASNPGSTSTPGQTSTSTPALDGVASKSQSVGASADDDAVGGSGTGAGASGVRRSTAGGISSRLGTTSAAGGGSTTTPSINRGEKRNPLKPPKPTRADLRGMKDVVAAVKEYRKTTRRAYEEMCRQTRARGGKDSDVRLGAPHFHWCGKLEVQLEEGDEGLFHQRPGGWR